MAVQLTNFKRRERSNCSCGALTINLSFTAFLLFGCLFSSTVVDSLSRDSNFLSCYKLRCFYSVSGGFTGSFSAFTSSLPGGAVLWRRAKVLILLMRFLKVYLKVEPNLSSVAF